jgi:hypothetical protein
VDRHLLLDLGVPDHQEAPALHVAAGGSGGTRLEDLPDQRFGYRIGFQSPHRAGGMDDLE